MIKEWEVHLSIPMQPEKWHQEGIKYLNLNQSRKLKLSVLNVCGANAKEDAAMAASTCSLVWHGGGEDASIHL